MAKHISYFEYGQVYPPPLVDGAPPVVTEPDAEQPVTLGAPWWAIGWYIALTAILGATCIQLFSEPLPTLWPPAWPECAIGSTIGLGLVGITIIVRTCARRTA